MKIPSLFFCTLSLIFFVGQFALAQAKQSRPAAAGSTINKKLSLEDITVKGELLSDDRMNFVRRQREELKNRIKFRINFRPEILQEYKN